MAINGFEFPRVTLEQQYAAAAGATVQTLGVVCIGLRYTLHRADKPDEAAEVPQTAQRYSSANGLTVASLPGHVIGGTPDLDDKSTQRLVVKDGIFSYYIETIEDVENPEFVCDDNVITFEYNVKSGNDQAAASMFGSRGVRVGDPLIIVTPSGNVIADVVKITASTPGGGYNQIEVAMGYSGALSTATGVAFCIRQDATFEQKDVTAFTVTPTTTAGGTTYSTHIEAALEIALDDLDNIEGTLQAGDLFLEYREQLTTGLNKLGTLSSLADVDETLGGVSKDNPLAMACYFAMAGGGGNAVVYYMVIDEDTPSAYTKALDILEKYPEVYSIVPCTDDEDIVKACMTSCIDFSTDIDSKGRHALWYGINVGSELILWSGSGTFSTSTVTLTENVFVDYPLQEGDVLRVANDTTEYTIVSTNGLNTATIQGTASGTKSLLLVRKQPTNADIIEKLIEMRKARSTSERGMCVWADGIVFEDQAIANYAGAAAAAGMRSAQPCQRPISNLGYSFFSIADTHDMSMKELEQLGAEGIWLIGNNSNEVPTNLRQVTTAVANNLLLDEESIISNADTLAINLSHIGEDLVGNSNITPDLLSSLRTSISEYLRSCTINTTGSVYIGPQLLDWSIVNIWQDNVNLDHVYADITVTPPRPFNRFHIIMRVI